MNIGMNANRLGSPCLSESCGWHVGRNGPRPHARESARYVVGGALSDQHQGELWMGFFIAGDLLSVVAGEPAGGPMEIALFDPDMRTLVLSKTPGGVCRAGARAPRSGMYAVRVRDLRDTSACVPFVLLRVRHLPQRQRRRPAGNVDGWGRPAARLTALVAHCAWVLERLTGRSPRQGPIPA